MYLVIYILSTVLQLSSVVLSLIMIRKTGRPFVWIAIALLILLKMVSNIFTFHGYVLAQPNTVLFLFFNLLTVLINIFLLLSVFWLASTFRLLDRSNKRLLLQREIEEKLSIFSKAIEQSPSVVVITDLEGNIEYINPMFTKITGYTKEDVIGQNPRILKSGETSKDEYEKLWKTITEGGTWTGELHNKKKNGELYWESASISGIKDVSGVISHYLAVKKDITMEKEAKIKMEESLKEKGLLLRELYHRTKNNMQVITSLFRLKSMETDNSEIHQVFEDMENRIHSMSLVHEKLYQSKNLSRINLGEYFEDLLAHIKGSYNLGSGRISISSDIEDISVQIDTATPLGLIFNELVSNSMKHAFPETRKGEIRISLKRTDNEKIIMKVTDNGIGFPENYNFKESTSLGLQIIHALGEGQLMGNVEMESNGGLTCKVSFKDNIYTARI